MILNVTLSMVTECEFDVTWQNVWPLLHKYLNNFASQLMRAQESDAGNAESYVDSRIYRRSGITVKRL
jgi:hypothetical protein